LSHHLPLFFLHGQLLLDPLADLLLQSFGVGDLDGDGRSRSLRRLSGPGAGTGQGFQGRVDRLEGLGVLLGSGFDVFPHLPQDLGDVDHHPPRYRRRRGGGRHRNLGRLGGGRGVRRRGRIRDELDRPEERRGLAKALDHLVDHLMGEGIRFPLLLGPRGHDEVLEGNVAHPLDPAPELATDRGHAPIHLARQRRRLRLRGPANGP
jgi:hypothetical protein